MVISAILNFFLPPPPLYNAAVFDPTVTDIPKLGAPFPTIGKLIYLLGSKYDHQIQPLH
jgi:hypothetical protein